MASAVSHGLHRWLERGREWEALNVVEQAVTPAIFTAKVGRSDPRRRRRRGPDLAGRRAGPVAEVEHRRLDHRRAAPTRHGHPTATRHHADDGDRAHGLGCTASSRDVDGATAGAYSEGFALNGDAKGAANVEVAHSLGWQSTRAEEVSWVGYSFQRDVLAPCGTLRSARAAPWAVRQVHPTEEVGVDPDAQRSGDRASLAFRWGHEQLELWEQQAIELR